MFVYGMCVCVHKHWYAVNYIPGFECGSEIRCCYPPKPTQLSNLLNTAVVAVTHGSKTAQIDTHRHTGRIQTNTHTHSLTHLNVASRRGKQRGRENPSEASEWEGLFGGKICRQSISYLRCQLRDCVHVCGHLSNQSSSSTTKHLDANTFTILTQLVLNCWHV